MSIFVNFFEKGASLLDTRQQYGLYETGKRTIPVNYLKILAKFYDTSCDYILELTDEIKPYKPKVLKK